MTKKSVIYLAAFVCVAATLILSCTKDKGKTPVETPPPPPGACDTITWNKHIKTIIETKCSTTPGCHTGPTPTGNTNLDTYAQVKEKATAGRIKDRVIDKAGTQQSMPPPSASQLSAEQKQLVQCWLDNGQKEN